MGDRSGSRAPRYRTGAGSSPLSVESKRWIGKEKNNGRGGGTTTAGEGEKQQQGKGRATARESKGRLEGTYRPPPELQFHPPHCRSHSLPLSLPCFISSFVVHRRQEQVGVLCKQQRRGQTEQPRSTIPLGFPLYLFRQQEGNVLVRSAVRPLPFSP